MSTQKTWYEKKRLRLTQGYIDQNIYSTDEATGEVKIIGKYESGIDAYKKSKVKLDSKLLGHLISRAQTREKYVTVDQQTNHLLAKMMGATINGIQKAIRRLEDLGLIKRTYYAGHFRNIHLNLNEIYTLSDVVDFDHDFFYNKKTEDPVGRKKVKHGGYSRLDITRRRLVKDRLWFTDDLKQDKEKKKYFNLFLLFQSKRKKFNIREDALQYNRDLNIGKEKTIQSRDQWNHRIELNADIERDCISYLQRLKS